MYLRCEIAGNLAAAPTFASMVVESERRRATSFSLLPIWLPVLTLSYFDSYRGGWVRSASSRPKRDFFDAQTGQ